MAAAAAAVLAAVLSAALACAPAPAPGGTGVPDQAAAPASAGAAGQPGVAVAGSAISNPFAAHALWDDGRAEVNAYDAAERRYGVLRPFTAYHIVVKEDLSRAQLVKADPGHDPADLVTVLKLNQVIEYQTGIYTYHQMASTFHARDGMDLLKFSLTSFEWCGNTYKEYTRRGSRATLHAHTYWDGMAEVAYDLPVGPDVVLYDAMPLWVRSLPQASGTSRDLRLVPGQISSQAPKPVIAPATLRAVGEEEVTTPAGRFRAMRWELTAGGGAPDTYWLARDHPRLLVAWDKPDGGRYRLKWTQRLAYWTLNAPGGEKHLAGPSLAPPPR
jgi:hypothetical protein